MITNSFYKEIERANKVNNNRVVSHLKLVVRIANKYAMYADVNDLISEGTIGLCYADRSYSEDKCDAFLPYAKLCIESYIRNYLRDMNNVVRVGQLDQKDGARCYSESLFYTDDESNEVLRSDVIEAVDTYDIMSTDAITYNAFQKGLDALPDVSRTVMKMRLKLDEYSDLDDNSLGNIAKVTGLSRYKVNQIIDSSVSGLHTAVSRAAEF